jgi:hypothetical protein
MTNQNSDPIPDPNTPPPEYKDWREQRREERHTRHEERWQRRSGRPYGWFGGAILILLGVIFLLQNLGLPFLTNWWALFILIPTFGAFAAAWNVYQENGRLTRGAAGSLAVGFLLTVLTVAFLLNLGTGVFWPILLIAGGVVVLATSFLPG